MRKPPPFLLAILVGATLACGTGAALARDGDGEAMPTQSAPSRDQLIDELQHRYNARVVRLDEIQVDGKAVYEVRLLSDADARVWTIRIDPATGRELPRS